MSLLDKVKFWKKDEPSFGDIKMDAPIGGSSPTIGANPPDLTPGLGGTGDLGGFDSAPGGFGSPPQEDFGLPPPGLTHQPMQSQPLSRPVSPMVRQMPSDILSKDIEIISSKLDALRATLEAINQRLSNIEREVFERRRGGW